MEVSKWLSGWQRALPIGAIALVASIASALPASALITGAVEFSTDPAGNSFGGQMWNTLAPPPPAFPNPTAFDASDHFNIYFSTDNGATFLNHLDVNPNTEISLSTTTPGTFT